VSVLNIELLTPGESTGQTQLDEASSLREYYLNWENFGQTEGGVEKLIASFWTLFGGSEQRQTALKLLGLDQSASEQQIKRRYRVLAARHHPDKGGDEIRFIEIRQAYETLIIP
jgi:DnaJ-domain-containing protein 1